MKSRVGLCAGGAALLAAVLGTPLAAQAPAKRANSQVVKSIPRAADGHPDLQGNWSTAVLTPLERPAEFAGRPTISEEEAAAYAKRLLNELDEDRPDGGAAGRLNSAVLKEGETTAERKYGELAGKLGAYNNLFVDQGTELTKVDGLRRTSLVIDPPDGKIPPRTAEGLKLAEMARRESAGEEGGGGSYDHLNEDLSGDYRHLPLGVRCVYMGGAPPFHGGGGGGYNNNHQIVQTQNAIMIMHEMNHEVRVIHLDRRTHLDRDVRLWFGDSIGHWEGDTLIVETTNFKAPSQGASNNLKVIEHFRRVDANSILYRATIDDPTVFTKPWTIEFSFTPTGAPIYEYACLEGNYSVDGILGGEQRKRLEKLGQPNK